jgi:hypothetical protein
MSSATPAPIEELEYSQDNAREFAQIDLFGLIPNPGRLGHDAVSPLGHKFELKTTTKSHGAVSTARDLGPNKLKEWRQYYWIVTRGKKPKGQAFVPLRHFFLAPVHMEDWYAKLEEGFAADVALAEKITTLAATGLSEAEATRSARLLYRGMLLNDPTISWKYIESHGIEIVGDPVATIANLVDQFPIDDSAAAK